METPVRRNEGLLAPRVLYMEHGTWFVYERTYSYDRRRRPALIFESSRAIRRVRDYPEDWRQLSDEALRALSWRR